METARRLDTRELLATRQVRPQHASACRARGPVWKLTTIFQTCKYIYDVTQSKELWLEHLRRKSASDTLP